VRVRAHHLENPDRASGLGEFQRQGYFAGVRLAQTLRGLKQHAELFGFAAGVLSARGLSLLIYVSRTLG
jgi:hypothetical protein